jgi:RNA polymerase sigma-70 factor (ECF subfamily)
MSEQVVTNNALAGPSYLHWHQGLDQIAPQCRADDADASLVAGLRTRQEAAFIDLVRRYQHPLLSAALRITKNREDAEEVVQDTFLKVFQYIKSFRGNSLFRTWVTRIAINQGLMKIRKNTRDYLCLDENGEDGRGAAIKETKAAAGYTPEESCSVLEIESIALKLIPKISRSSQPIMKLCLQKELSQAEVAEHLKLKLSTVKSRLFRGRKELRDALAKHCSPEAIPRSVFSSRLRPLPQSVSNSRWANASLPAR